MVDGRKTLCVAQHNASVIVIVLILIVNFGQARRTMVTHCCRAVVRLSYSPCAFRPPSRRRRSDCFASRWNFPFGGCVTAMADAQWTLAPQNFAIFSHKLRHKVKFDLRFMINHFLIAFFPSLGGVDMGALSAARQLSLRPNKFMLSSAFLLCHF